MIHESDIAAVAAVALTGDALLGTRPELTGPEELTTAEQAMAIGEALGMPVRFEEIPHGVACAEAVAAGYPDDLVEALFDHATEFPAQPVTSIVRDITGNAVDPSVGARSRRGVPEHRMSRKGMGPGLRPTSRPA